ncbi:hypothetical protein ACFW53_20650 [Nocardiopsis dassonvillei]|uniref:hypothetical protein n=1 Tax=Nocardiopsis dassonvillei TaxID=2014 RepID=UPI00366C0942
MRITHRTCRAETAALYSEVEALHTKAALLARDVEALTAERDDLEKALVESQNETQELQTRAMFTEGLCLEGRGHSISLEQLLDEYERGESVLQARRRRAAETALGDAWHGFNTEWAARSAAVAQAILALPLEAFDPEITYEHGRWYVDGERVSPFALPDREQERLQERYGLTDDELTQIREGRQEPDEVTPEESIELLEEQIADLQVRRSQLLLQTTGAPF